MKRFYLKVTLVPGLSPSDEQAARVQAERARQAIMTVMPRNMVDGVQIIEEEVEEVQWS